MAMNLLPIVITARRDNWRRYLIRKNNQAFIAIETKILRRDDYTCRYCGFYSEKYLTVINHDSDYSNNEETNLVTACQFCMQCFFIDAIGHDNHSGGYIIYLPEISQADLNHFCRALFASMLKDVPYRGKLQTCYLSLKDRSLAIDETFGPGSHVPSNFGQALIDSNLSPEELKSEIFSKLRLLPERRYFKEEIAYWKDKIYDQIPL